MGDRPDHDPARRRDGDPGRADRPDQQWETVAAADPQVADAVVVADAEERGPEDPQGQAGASFGVGVLARRCLGLGRPVGRQEIVSGLDPHRETVRRHVLHAYTALAEAEPDPYTARAIIQDAIRVDPYNENLYQRAMHQHAHLGGPDGIRRTLRTITKRLGELEIPLSPRTQQTASHLLERLALRERLSHHPTT